MTPGHCHVCKKPYAFASASYCIRCGAMRPLQRSQDLPSRDDYPSSPPITPGWSSPSYSSDSSSDSGSSFDSGGGGDFSGGGGGSDF